MTQEQDSQGQARQSEAGDRPRVLLVDDAAAIRNAIRGVLEDAGSRSSERPPTGSRASPWPARSTPTWC